MKKVMHSCLNTLKDGWKLFFLLFFVSLLAFGCDSSDYKKAAGTSNSNTPPVVMTTRDAQGIWFISGPDNASLYDVFEAMGYAVATDRLWQAELYRRTARGRLAEILGEDQLPTDVFMRVTGYSDRELAEAFDNLDTESREVINGYVAGFNHRIAELKANPELLPYEFRAVGNQLGREFYPEDWVPTDVLAWMATMLRNFDPEGIDVSPVQFENAELYSELLARHPADFQAMFQDLRWISDPDALTYIPGTGASKAQGREELNQLPPFASSLPDMSGLTNNIRSNRKTVLDNLKKINAFVKMGSYAWTISGNKTASGNATLYSGPQMGFSVPSITVEGSIRAGGIQISGMTVPGIPGIIIGRTPHHAWSMQVGHAHTSDYYIENPSAVTPHRLERIRVAGGEDVMYPVYRTAHGPVINPLKVQLTPDYTPDPNDPTTWVVSWKYSHWNYELNSVKALLTLARAKNMDEFGKGIDLVPVSQHFCYADRDGNIAYWMSGRDPVRPEGEYRFPQGFIPGVAPLEWDAAVVIPRAHDRNSPRGYYGGWNNRASADYPNAFNNLFYFFGPFHRGQVVEDYLSTHDNLTFEEIRDLALNIATTDSFGSGGNPWKFAAPYFKAAVENAPSESRTAAIELLDAWDGHFVDGGQSQWVAGKDRADAWILMDQWLREALRLTFEDELGEARFDSEKKTNLFNTMLHGLAGENSSIQNLYNWFTNKTDANAPQTADDIIVTALDNTLLALGERPWGTNERGEIEYHHDLFKGTPMDPIHKMPFASRSTYAHCVEMGANGPVRIESMFPLGESGTILMNADGTPSFDPNFFSMAMDEQGNPARYDIFVYRDFPLFN